MYQEQCKIDCRFSVVSFCAKVGQSAYDVNDWERTFSVEDMKDTEEKMEESSVFGRLINNRGTNNPYDLSLNPEHIDVDGETSYITAGVEKVINKGFHTEMNKTVVLASVRLDEIRDSREKEKKFRREIRSLCLLSDHPYSVTFHGYCMKQLNDHQDETCALVMEHLKCPKDAWSYFTESSMHEKHMFAAKIARVLCVIHSADLCYCKHWSSLSTLNNSSDSEAKQHHACRW